MIALLFIIVGILGFIAGGIAYTDDEGKIVGSIIGCISMIVIVIGVLLVDVS